MCLLLNRKALIQNYFPIGEQLMDSSFTKSNKKQYPIQEIGLQQLEDNKKKAITKLLYLFVFYSSKSSKHSFQELHQNHFIEMMSDIWKAKGRQLQKNKGTWKQLQILYYTKGRKNALLFKNFLDMLPTIACYFQPEFNRQDSLKSLIHHIDKLYQSRILPQIDGKVINCKDNVDQETREFLIRLMPDLTKLYKVYFTHEIVTQGSKKNIQTQSFDAFEEFLKDFQIFPKLISARETFYIFHQSCQSPPSDLLYETDDSRPVVTEMGCIFKLSKFIDSLIILSRRVFSKLKQIENEEQWEKESKFIVRTLLEYMETVKSMTKKKPKYIYERFCLIVLDQHPQQQKIKSIQVKDKIIREHSSNMDFFTLMDKIKL